MGKKLQTWSKKGIATTAFLLLLPENLLAGINTENIQTPMSIEKKMLKLTREN